MLLPSVNPSYLCHGRVLALLLRLGLVLHAGVHALAEGFVELLLALGVLGLHAVEHELGLVVVDRLHGRSVADFRRFQLAHHRRQQPLISRLFVFLGALLLGLLLLEPLELLGLLLELLLCLKELRLAVSGVLLVAVLLCRLVLGLALGCKRAERGVVLVGLGEALLELLPLLLGRVRELLELRMNLLLRGGCVLAERRGRLLVYRVLVLGLGGRRGGDLLVRRLLRGLGLAVSLELGQLITRLCACASKVGSRESGRRRHEFVRSSTHLVGDLVARMRLAEHNRVGHVEVEGLLGSRARDESVG